VHPKTAVGQTSLDSEFQAGIVFGKTALDHEGSNDSASSSMESPAHPSVHQPERTRQEDGTRSKAYSPLFHRFFHATSAAWRRFIDIELADMRTSDKWRMCESASDVPK
jgi:hypothetical protein